MFFLKILTQFKCNICTRLTSNQFSTKLTSAPSSFSDLKLENQSVLPLISIAGNTPLMAYSELLIFTQPSLFIIIL